MFRAMAELWDLLFTLPNLDPPIPTPFESDGFAICSGKDPRLKQLAADQGNQTALRMLERFRTHSGTPYRPGCFLIRASIPKSARNDEAILAFRNLCALSATTSASAAALETPSGAQWRVLWSDQFQFGYFIAGTSGWVQTLDGASMGMTDEIPLQH